MFTKTKVFAYENSEGDKGVIIAKSLKDAERIFKREYPDRTLVKDGDGDYWKNGVYLYEMSDVKNNELYCCFPA